MKKVRVYFVDFWDGFDFYDNIFYILLSKKYHVIVDPINPDYLFCSCFSYNVYKYENSVKIYFTGENNVPDFNIYDYAIGFQYVNFEDRYLRFPLYLFYIWENLENMNLKHISGSLTGRKFCNFVYSNKQNADPIRDKFFFELSKYKKVDSGGRLYNNIGGPVKDKCAFLRDYKFTIAFENSSVNGYTTEKVVEPMLVNSIPIYWGNKLIGRENEKEHWTDLLMSFLDNIFKQSFLEAKRCPKFGFVKNYIREEKRASYLKKNYLWNKMCGLVEKISNKN